MNEAKYPRSCESDMMTFRPLHIRTRIGKIRGEHGSELGHFLAPGFPDESFGINGALFGLGVIEFAPRIEINHQLTPIYGFFMAAEPAFGTFVLPTLTHPGPPGSSPRVFAAQTRAREEGWRLR